MQSQDTVATMGAVTTLPWAAPCLWQTASIPAALSSFSPLLPVDGHQWEREGVGWKGRHGEFSSCLHRVLIHL